MSDFGDQLRATLKKKSEQLFARQMQEERQLQEAKRQLDETHAVARRLSREVFGPLLQEFLEVMQSAGVFCGGTVEQGATQRVPGTEQGVRNAADSPLPASSSVLRAPCSMLSCRAMGTAPGSPHFEVRIACSVVENGRIDVAVQCLDTTAAEFESSAAEQSQKTLVELPAKSFKTPAIHDDAVRQWCAGLLKKCADACMEENSKRRN
jgi:hypothetical protein